MQDVTRYVKRTCRMGTKEMENFHTLMNERELVLNNDTPLDMKAFLANFSFMKDLEIFQWLYNIFRGYENKHLNFDETPVANQDERRLTVATVDRQKSVIQANTSLINEDLTLIQEFYDREIKTRPAKYVHVVFSRMFRCMPN